MTYNFLTAGLQNVLLLVAVVKEVSSPTFMFFFCFFRSVLTIASCDGLNFVNFCTSLLTFFISISHKD